ncbi:transposase [Marinomonas pollencensis]|uniref:DDE family transposase n=1 Tax=Marinomonas pollencensis TaxID=491954 RepID=A0A3E0DGX9_9GAMM|nr:DDE family transposase [Marinomonas pollencensis]
MSDESVRPSKFFDEESQSWRCISHLFPTANATPKSVVLNLGQSKPHFCHLALYKRKPKGRHSLNQDGSTKASKTSLTAARGAKESWLLISSLPKNSSFAKKSVKVYQTRMQIEESFRYMKNTKFGLGFEHNHTKILARMKLLVLLTTLTAMVLILLGKVVELVGLSYRFQSTSTRKRRVLSHFFWVKEHYQRTSKSPSNNGEKELGNSPNICSKEKVLWFKFAGIPQH